jgi:hypothetical protein
MYKAFEEGNIAAVLHTLSEDTKWVYTGANPTPVRQAFEGRKGVESFFAHLFNTMTILSFLPKEFYVQDDTVIVMGEESGTVKATGEHFRNVWVQKYVVKQNLITGMEEYNIRVNESLG